MSKGCPPSQWVVMLRKGEKTKDIYISWERERESERGGENNRKKNIYIYNWGEGEGE
jgi:hypothetical protein